MKTKVKFKITNPLMEDAKIAHKGFKTTLLSGVDKPDYCLSSSQYAFLGQDGNMYSDWNIQSFFGYKPIEEIFKKI